MSNLSQFFSGGAKVWVSGTTYAIGNVVLSPADNYQQYVRITNGAGTTDPSSDTTNYRPYGGRAIKSIQRGLTAVTTSTSLAVTISSVDTSKSILSFLGQSGADATVEPGRFEHRVSLTNGTTITINKGASVGTTYTVNWQLVEYY